MSEHEDDTHSKVELSFLVGDPLQLSTLKDTERFLQGWHYRTDEPLLDGPISRRVAIVDFDPRDGHVIPGAKFEPAKKGRKLARYKIPDKRDPYSDAFRNVSVFSAILWTLSQFEGPDVLGRKIKWAFDGEQLLVVPRAGIDQNAFYHRNSRSLQFFYFKSGTEKDEKTVYTCLSPDIVSHETAHAILDGIAPDLYDAVSPQSLALHEAIADLTTVIVAVQTKALAERVLALSGGDLKKTDAFSKLAEEFGTTRGNDSHALRNLENDHALIGGTGTQIESNEPHDLSTVLSGALYALLVEAHEKLVQEITGSNTPTAQARFSASGSALFRAGQRFKRMAFRGLDYLPPGEIAFADYGRAIIAADAAFHPDPRWERTFVKKEFETRGIVKNASELEPLPISFTLPPDLDMESLRDSDWYAYQFAEKRRADLFIPPEVPFLVRPRLDVTKTAFRSEGATETRELIFKVSWEGTQSIKRYGTSHSVRATFGTTIVLDWNNGTVRALLSTSALHPSQQHAATALNHQMRAAYLEHAIDEGLVEFGTPEAQFRGGVLKLRGFAQHLHMMGAHDDH